MQDSTRQFKSVFLKAQMILDLTFGLRLQELPSKAWLDQEAAAAAAAETKKGRKSGSAAQDGDDELEEARRAVVGKRKSLSIPPFIWN